MDVAIPRRKHTNKKGNKENAKPEHGSKSYIKRDKTSVTPFQVKSNENDETLKRNGPLEAKAKRVDTRSASGKTQKKVKPMQKDGKGTAATDFSQNVAGEAVKPPAAVPSSKSAPGMYKGKIVQSKIGSIWKSSASVGSAVPKSSVAITETQRVGNVMKDSSKSHSGVPACGTQKPRSTRPKSVSSKSAQVSMSTVTSRPLVGFYSARSAKTVPPTLTTNSSRNTTMAPTKGSGTQNSKTKITMTDKVNKPPVSSALSQYKFTMETAEERRAKLAGWLASKGRTLKRPAMTTAAPQKTKVFGKPKAELKSHSQNKPQPVADCGRIPERSLEATRPDPASVANCADTKREVFTYSQTPVVMDTSLELLDPQDRMDDIVVNLCDTLEAMATPSRCNNELAQLTDECGVETEEAKDSYKKEVQNEMPKDVAEQPKSEQVENEAEESDDVEEVESDDDSVNTPQMENASVVKYCVKTTPYLQSVKKTIEGEVSTSTSRRKSNIKDLKFLTPVRRSCRIQRKSSHLPTMLVDHDPCVSSLAELVNLDDDPNAYIYRKNPALLEDLPDQTEL